jgi:hypothetical protein
MGGLISCPEAALKGCIPINIQEDLQCSTRCSKVAQWHSNAYRRESRADPRDAKGAPRTLQR